MRKSRCGLIRSARDSAASARPVGFASPARLSNGAGFGFGFALIVHIDYNPAYKGSKTWEKFRAEAKANGCVVERIGDEPGPPDSVRAIGPVIGLHNLANCKYARSYHLDAPTTVVSAAGGGPERVRRRPTGPNTLAADERDRLSRSGFDPYERAEDGADMLPLPHAYYGNPLLGYRGMPEQFGGSGI